MNVLSLFDGISCGQLALQRAGIKVDKYYASEVDKYAIQVAQKNFPDTIQLGDITKWQEWNIDWSSIGLLIGGSPCQGFSFAGKQLNFDDPRSKLFFIYADILNHIKTVNPNVIFLLENVKMKKDYQDVISSYLGVQPIEINSSLVSAQNRVRLYWTNISGVKHPKDKNIYLKDIIKSGYVDKTKSYCIDANYFRGGNLKNYFEKHRRQLVFELKKDAEQVFTCRENGRRLTVGGEKRDDINGLISRGYEINFSGRSGALTTVLKDNYMIENFEIRKLYPEECERLQTLPDNYTTGISDTQRYKCLGNGWTVDVISHIFSHINTNKLTIPNLSSQCVI
jgi:DNA-cytosine methyltransferase